MFEETSNIPAVRRSLYAPSTSPQDREMPHYRLLLSYAPYLLLLGTLGYGIISKTIHVCLQS
jgi:hypothetical protein